MNNNDFYKKLLVEYPACEKVLNFLEKKSSNEYDFAINSAKDIYEYKLDEDAICASLLLYSYMQKSLSTQDIKDLTNDEILKLLEQVEKINKIDTEDKVNEAENIRQMIFALSKDIRVIIIKLIYIMQVIKTPNNSDEFKYFVEEIRDIYAPLAGRLGLSKIKINLEDFVLNYEHPDIYSELIHNEYLKASEREEQLQFTKEKLNVILNDLQIKNGEVMGRKKHYASIYKKMKNKSVTIGQIYDLVALRVLVNTIEECYAVLGKVHAIYKPMPNRFKDYISMPKPNGYQSLHTTVIAENGKPLEIQIRTFDMHRIAEYGIAAHWMYKEKRNKATTLDEKLGWVRQLMEKGKDIKASEFVDELKLDLYSDEIFVQTPKGKVMQFPLGATVIDFAYAIHSDIGDNCMGAKINGKMVPIFTELKNGDVIEIIVSPQPKGPSRDWLNHAITSSAKDKINAYFKRELKDDNIKKGKTMFEQACKAKSISMSKILNDTAMTSLFKKYNLSNEEDMFASIGYGGLTTTQVINKLLQETKTNEKYDYNILSKNVVNTKSQIGDAIIIRGQRGILTRFAGCCNPIPGDEIVGFVSHGRGVTIHKADCSQIKNFDNDRFVEAAWANQIKTAFNASLKIIAGDKNAFLRDFTLTLANNKINLKKLDIKEELDKTIVNLIISVGSVDLLNEFIKNLRKITSVYEVTRI